MKLVFTTGSKAGDYARAIHHERCLDPARVAEHERFERERYELFSGNDGSHITIRNAGGRPKLRCNHCSYWASWVVEGSGVNGEPGTRGSWIVCDDCREWARNTYRASNAATIVETEIGDLDCWTCAKPIRDGDPFVAPILLG